jgi:hypothetical protein
LLYRGGRNGGPERQPGFRHGREGAEVPRRAVYVSYARVVRSGALDLVGAHLRTRVQDTDVFQCLDALRRDDVARRIVDRLGPPA